MSFHLDLPPFFRAVDDAYLYLTRLVNHLNYALGFLDVPDAVSSAATAADGNDRVLTISNKSTNAQMATGRAVYEYAVPKTRQVNGKALGEDITLAPADLGEADYVEATGSSDDWAWRRWHSGTVEMWAHSLIVTMGTFSDWTTELKYGSGNVTYPVELANANGSTVFAQLTTRDGETVNEVNGMMLSVVKRTTGATIRVVKNTSVSRVYADIYVRGTAAPVSE